MAVVQFRGEVIESKEIMRVLWLIVDSQIYV